MSKKVLVVVGLAAVIAASTGVISLTANPHRRSADIPPSGGDTSVTEASVDPDTDPEQGGGDPVSAPDDATQAAETVAAAPSVTPSQEEQESGSDPLGYADALSSHSNYAITRVIDHTSGDEVTAREVFGRQYYECYLSFGDGDFELCLNPVAGEIRRGTYTVYGDVISAAYSDGTGSEFDILTDDFGGIAGIVINYGDYDVYFG